MKTTKLLTSFVALSLILSLGACEIGDEEINSENDENTSTSNETSGCEGDACEQDPSNLATNPGELIEKAYEEGNYSLTLYIQEMVSDSISYEDYQNDNFDSEALLESMTTTLYTVKLYYSEDAVVCEMYRGESTYHIGILLVNDYWVGYGDVLWAYTRYGETDDWILQGLWYYHWQDYRNSLFYAYEEGVTGDDFVIYTTGTIDGEYTELYSATSHAATILAYSIGLDWWFTDVSREISKMYYDGVYFMPGTQSMFVEYIELYWAYASSTSTDNVVLVEELYDAYIYDVGNTDISQIIEDAMA